MEQGRHAGISDAEIRDILDEVVRRADPSVAESVRAEIQDLVRPDRRSDALATGAIARSASSVARIVSTALRMPPELTAG